MDYHLILASQSPRRQEIMRMAAYDFEVRIKETDESYPTNLIPNEVAEYIAQNKAQAWKKELKKDEILITADTVVIIQNQILGKASNAQEAKAMLRLLSGTVHEVITSVCLCHLSIQICFSENTKVYFKTLSDEEIDFYIEKYKPFDKAGAYGIQEWLGMVAVERIEGCFYNVMGLPMARLYTELEKFIKQIEK